MYNLFDFSYSTTTYQYNTGNGIQSYCFSISITSHVKKY